MQGPRDGHRPRELEALLGPPQRFRGDAVSAGELSGLFENLQERVRACEGKPAYRLATQPTGRRHLISVFAFGLVLGLTVALFRRHDLGDYPPAMLFAFLGSLGTLFGLSLATVLRPFYKPSLPEWQPRLLALATLGAALLLAVLPAFRNPLGTRPLRHLSVAEHALPCLVFGLGAGLPVYAVLRALDRGSPFGPLLSAAAAGLVGNMALELHCPLGGAGHLLSGHVMVLVAFVGAVIVFERAAALFKG